MPKKIDFSNTAITDRMVQFNDIATIPEKFRGFKLPILDPVYNLRYDDAIDFDGGQIVYSHEIVNGNTLPTLNDLVANGVIHDWHPFKETTLLLVDDPEQVYKPKNPNNEVRLFSDFAINSNPRKLSCPKVAEWFAERGMKVSTKALRHNYETWRYGGKSGYRDDKNGVFVFTPCGHINPLSFNISELHPTAQDWQITYEC